MRSVHILTITLLLLVAATVSVHAEDRPYLKATVPFAFTVGNVDLPAGTYDVSLFPLNGTVKIQNSQTGKWAMVMTRPAGQLEASAQSKIIFHRLAGRYFLSQLCEQGNSDYRSLPSGKLEKELAKGQHKMETTTILASAGAPKH